MEQAPELASSRLVGLLAGLVLVRRTPVLFGAISLDLFAVLFGGVAALLPAIAEDRLEVGAVGLGWLRAAGGIGAAGATVVLAALAAEGESRIGGVEHVKRGYEDLLGKLSAVGARAREEPGPPDP